MGAAARLSVAEPLRYNADLFGEGGMRPSRGVNGLAMVLAGSAGIAPDPPVEFADELFDHGLVHSGVCPDPLNDLGGSLSSYVDLAE